MKRVLAILAAALLSAGTAVAGAPQGPSAAWLPGRPEVFATRLPSGEDAYTARGRSRTVAEFLDALVAVAPRAVQWDPRSRAAASETVVTVDLHERSSEEIAELLAAAAGLDLVERGAVLAIEPPPPPDGSGPMDERRRSAQRFYLKALAEHPDEDTAARAHRGLAELHALAGDPAEAAVEYDLLLRLYRGSRHAVGASLLLARSLRAIGDRDRARAILLSSLEEEEDPQRREWALRWLFLYLVEDGDFEGLKRIAEVFLPPEDPESETLEAYLKAGMALVHADRPLDAISLLKPLWERSPARNAALAPVLAQAHLVVEDSASALRVLRLYTARHRSIPNSGPILLAFCDLALRLGDRVAALLCAEGAVRAPDSDLQTKRRARSIAADLLAALGLEERALAHLREIARTAPPLESEQAEMRAAALTLDLGKPEEARLLFQALVPSPQVGNEARLGVVRSFFASGSTARTREAVRDLLRAGPSEAQAEEALQFAVRTLEAEREFEKARRLASGDLSVLEEEQS